MTPTLQTIIKQHLALSSIHSTPIGGGSINECYRIESGNKMYFCKVNSATKFPHLFTKEKNGLELIGTQKIINVPVVIDCFEHENNQILLLEWIKQGERTENFWKNFGEQLATLHQTGNEYFGLDEDNYMGSIPQSNELNQIWIEFFKKERIQPMVKRCYDRELLSSSHLQQFENLYKELENIFEPEKPSLLHGDLWNGNFMWNQNNEPVLIDPAVYYGHRSMDLAMTTLFGGFRPAFYDSYHYHYPLPANYHDQWKICNLYPLLIHLDLFGSSYLPQIEHALKEYS